MKAFIFYASYLYFPFVALLVWVILREPKKRWRIVSGLLLVMGSLFAYARFVEPRILTVADHELDLCAPALTQAGEVRVAVFSDMHIGLFRNAMPLRWIAGRVNSLDPDFVLIPGDFTYHPRDDSLVDTFAPLSRIEAPTYAVMGNHDIGSTKEPDVSDPLTAALRAAGVTVIDGAAAVYDDGGQSINILGLPDFYEVNRGRGWGVPERLAQGPTIILEHNPLALNYWRGDLGDFMLMVAGHTHGGQIFVPGLTCELTFACDTIRYGFLGHEQGNIFVTSGTGMVGLPLRFNVPPVIDMLTIRYRPC